MLWFHVISDGGPHRWVHALLSYEGRPGGRSNPALGKDALDSLTDLTERFGDPCVIVCSWASLEDTDKIKRLHASEKNRTILPQRRLALQAETETEVQRRLLKCLVKASMNPSQIRAGSSSECTERSKERPALIFYNHVRKLSLSILVAASTDSMSLRMSELRASCRLGISSSPSTAMLSPSRVPRSTSVPGMASR